MIRRYSILLLFPVLLSALCRSGVHYTGCLVMGMGRSFCLEFEICYISLLGISHFFLTNSDFCSSFVFIFYL